jgi:hypothetical protein
MAQVRGDSPNDDGVVGTTNVSGKSGVFGFNPQAGGNGVAGISTNGTGVFAKSDTASGVFGASTTGLGVHGHSDNGDGILGVAKSPAKSGVFGSNESTGTANAPGGSGVFGLTLAPNAAGVFGANNSPSSPTNKGRGVQGNGPEAGVGGFSEGGVGVIGQSNQGDGAQGFTISSARNGILGRNSSTDRAPTGGPPAGNGVFGFTDVPNASGVCGAVGENNTEGAGVIGIGKTAGRFFGNVDVTGSLIVQGQDIGGAIEESKGSVKSLIKLLVPIILTAAGVTEPARTVAINAANLAIDEL